jgi:hypothetical protein
MFRQLKEYRNDIGRFREIQSLSLHTIFPGLTQPATGSRLLSRLSRIGPGFPFAGMEATMSRKRPVDRSDWHEFFRKIPIWVWILLLVLLFGRFVLVALAHIFWG